MSGDCLPRVRQFANLLGTRDRPTAPWHARAAPPAGLITPLITFSRGSAGEGDK
jgi:hypothetical protein